MIGNIDILVKELCKLPKEVGWVEFNHNYQSCYVQQALKKFPDWMVEVSERFDDIVNQE